MVPIIVLWTFFAYYTTPRIVEDKSSSHLHALQQVAQLLESHLSDSIKDLEMICSSPLLIDESEENREQRRNELVRLNQMMFRELFLLNKQGFIVDSSSPSFGMIQEYSPYFKQALRSGKTTVSEPYRSEDKSAILLSCYIPTPGSKERSVRAIKAVRELSTEWGFLRSVSKESGGDLTLVDADGNVLYSSSPLPLFSKFSSNNVLDAIRAGETGLFVNQEEKEMRYFSVPVNSYKREENGREWLLISMIPEAEFSWNLARINRGFAAVLLGTLFFLIPICIYFVRKTTSPLIVLSKASKAAGEGNYGSKVPHFGLKEVDEVGDAFNSMLDKVAASQKELESEVSKQTRKLSRTLSTLKSSNNAIEDGLLIFDRHGEILDANSAFNQLFSEENQTGIGNGTNIDDLDETLSDWLDERSSREIFTKPLSSQEVIEEEWSHAQDTRRAVSVVSAPIMNHKECIGRIWVFRDLTRYRALEEELRQSQKMEAIGTLAGGVAHDFNNLLTAISGNLSLCLPQLNDKSESYDLISTALSVTGRATGLVKQLLSFSRKSTLEIKPCDLGEIANETRNILTHTMDPSIEMEFDLTKDLWSVDADHNQMAQILMNLCVNARDAVERDGKITIRVKNTTRSVFLSDKGKNEVDDQFVCLEVIDTGSGMPLEVQKKIFDPFFTTKEQGKGTGLGLSTCYGIINQHNGWMECDSEAGHGTTMRVYLPKGKLQVGEEAPVEEIVESKDFDPSSHTVLIADDEPTVRSIAEILLKRAGYQIVTANNGAEALKIVQERDGALDLVMLDYTMPIMDGKETFKQISNEFPELPVMICSGYLCDFKEFETTKGLIPRSFVQKPYPLKDLLSQVEGSILNIAA